MEKTDLLSKKSLNKLTFSTLVLILFLISLPLFLPYIFHVHDEYFHLRRMGQIAEGLLQGQFPVRLQLGWYYDHGYPTGVYYGDILLYLPAVLHIIGIPLYKCYQLYVFFINALVVFSSYKCFYLISGGKDAALLGTALYSSSAWYLIDVYYRGSLGEYSAFAFLPFVISGFYLLLYSDKKTPERKRAVFFLVLGFSGILNTHIITTELVLGASFIFFLITINSFVKDNRLKDLFISVIGVSLVNAGFIVPFIHYFLGFRVLANFGGQIQSRGTNFMQWFSTVYNPDGLASDTKTGIAGSMPETPGIALLSALFISAIYLFSIPANNTIRKKQMALLASLSAFSLFLSTDIFPYDFLEKKLFLLYVFIGEYLQFPFRYFILSVIFISTLAVFTYVSIKEHSEILAYALWIFLVCLTLWQAIGLMSAKVNGETDINRYEDVSSVQESSDTLYLPRGVDAGSTSYRHTDILVAGERTYVSNVKRDYLSFDIEIINDSGKDSLIIFPLWNYPGYTAKDYNGNFLKITTDVNHELSVIVPSGYKGRLILAFKEPWFWRLAEAVSVISAVYITASMFRSIRGYGYFPGQTKR